MQEAWAPTASFKHTASALLPILHVPNQLHDRNTSGTRHQFHTFLWATELCKSKAWVSKSTRVTNVSNLKQPRRRWQRPPRPCAPRAAAGSTAAWRRRRARALPPPGESSGRLCPQGLRPLSSLPAPDLPAAPAHKRNPKLNIASFQVLSRYSAGLRSQCPAACLEMRAVLALIGRACLHDGGGNCLDYVQS